MSDGTERWLPVVGYEGYYEVSDLGRVRSIARVVNVGQGRTRRLPERILRPGINRQTGRRYVNLCRDGKQWTHTVYPLVLSAFVGPRPVGMEACHNDGDCLNDKLTNLRWDSSSRNTDDTVKHGRHNNASKTHCPRGHRLDEPNLTAWSLSRGHRDCLACEKTRMRRFKARSQAIELDFEAIADEYYAQIMKE